MRRTPWPKIRFNFSKGFGFITRDSGEDIFVHFKSIRATGEGKRGLREKLEAASGYMSKPRAASKAPKPYRGPAGSVPPVEEVTLRTEADMEPFLREPMSEGWKPVYQLPKIGQL